MFRKLDAKKLSSKHQAAHVFAYPGANAETMKQRLIADKHFTTVKSANTIVLMSGTNNVDGVYFGHTELASAKHDLTELINYLTHRFPMAKLKVINILPRKTRGRNDIIRDLNCHLKLIAQKYGAEYVDSESEFKLFSFGMKRHEKYFMPASDRYPDNCHLNNIGLVRFSKHLKFVAHH